MVFSLRKYHGVSSMNALTRGGGSTHRELSAGKTSYLRSCSVGPQWRPTFRSMASLFMFCGSTMEAYLRVNG